jgi:hypothetical protein
MLGSIEAPVFALVVQEFRKVRREYSKDYAKRHIFGSAIYSRDYIR